MNGFRHPGIAYDVYIPTVGRDVVVIRFYQKQRSFYANCLTPDHLKTVVFFMVKTVGIFFLNILILFLTGCVSIGSKPLAEKQIQHNDIEIFFTPSPDCENNIIKRINESGKIDIAVYSITNPKITNAIIGAYKKGANIRIITDKTQAKGKKSLVADLKKAGIPILTNKKHKIEHNKFAVFDDDIVVSGSYNWTTSASRYNSENCVFFEQPNKEYTQRFQYLWGVYNE